MCDEGAKSGVFDSREAAQVESQFRTLVGAYPALARDGFLTAGGFLHLGGHEKEEAIAEVEEATATLTEGRDASPTAKALFQQVFKARREAAQAERQLRYLREEVEELRKRYAEQMGVLVRKVAAMGAAQAPVEAPEAGIPVELY